MSDDNSREGDSLIPVAGGTVADTSNLVRRGLRLLDAQQPTSLQRLTPLEQFMDALRQQIPAGWAMTLERQPGSEGPTKTVTFILVARGMDQHYRHVVALAHLNEDVQRAYIRLCAWMATVMQTSVLARLPPGLKSIAQKQFFRDMRNPRVKAARMGWPKPPMPVRVTICRCGRISGNPRDVIEGYCRHCKRVADERTTL